MKAQEYSSLEPGRAVFGQYTGLDGTTRTLDVSEARFAAVTEELAVTRENPVKLLQALALAPVYIEVRLFVFVLMVPYEIDRKSHV